MLLSSLVALMLAVAPQDAQAAPQGAPGAPVIEISARLVRADGGSAGSSASRSSTGAFSGYLWTDANCNLGGADRETGNSPAVAWQFSAHVVQLVNDTATVRIDWQRVWDRSTRMPNGSQSSVTKTMSVGERVALDRADLPTGMSCGTSSVRLEASLIRESSTTSVGMPGGRGGRGAGTFAGARPRGGGAGADAMAATAAAGARGGRGAGAGGGRGMGTGTGTGTGIDVTAARAGSATGTATTSTNTNTNTTATAAAGVPGGRGGRGAGMGTSTAATATSDFSRPMTQPGGRGTFRGRGGEPTYTAELWLVHSVPTDPVSGSGNASRDGMRSQREEVVQQTVRFPAMGSGFTFPAMSIETAAGRPPVVVIVMGTLSARADNGTPSALIVTVSRQVIGTDKAVGSIGGSSTKEVPWPKTGDVLSFELPASGSGSDSLANDKFSIRLRIGTGMGSLGDFSMGGRGAGRGGKR